MGNYRRNRINEEIAKELMNALGSVKDPRVSGSFVSITAVDCSADLKYAKIYVSVMGNDDAEKDVIAGLKSASGFLRGRLASTLNLRLTPELTFIGDSSIKHGAHINDLLKQISTDNSEESKSDDD